MILMIGTPLAKALNEQLNNEYEAAQAYMAKAAYCEHNNYSGFANYYLQQAEEERFHGMKVYHYLNDRGIQAIFRDRVAPKNEFKSILETFEYSLEQEKKVTAQYYKLMDLAWE